MLGFEFTFYHPFGDGGYRRLPAETYLTARHLDRPLPARSAWPRVCPKGVMVLRKCFGPRAFSERHSRQPVSRLDGRSEAVAKIKTYVTNCFPFPRHRSATSRKANWERILRKGPS